MPAAITLVACGTSSTDESESTDAADEPRRVPEPLAMIRSSWSTDEWARGSYSFLPVGATPALRVALAQPINGRLFFAGGYFPG